VGLGFVSLEAFEAEVQSKRAAVEAIAATLGEAPPQMHLEAARLLDPLRDRAEVERLATAAGFADAEAAADTLEALGARLPAALLEQAIASPDPDRALLHFRDLTQTNQELVQSTSALNDMMLALSNIGGLNEQTFADMEAQGKDTFDQLTAAGFTRTSPSSR
jgi:hypothetical protein